jgi:hypothetical protein
MLWNGWDILRGNHHEQRSAVPAGDDQGITERYYHHALVLYRADAR